MKNPNNPNKKKKGNWKRTLLIIACVILSLLLIAIIGAAIYADGLLNRINYIDPDDEHTLSASDASNIQANDPDAVTIDPNDDDAVDADDIHIGGAAPLEQGGHILNIMLVGQDRREGEGRQRSDSMILVTFNTSKKTITLTSFMRDQFVNIPGYGKTKLNHSYQYGGMKLLKETIYNHYGVEIHGMVEVDFSGFEDIIDLLGGVDIDLTSKEAKKLNSGGKWGLSSGMNHLNGEQALMYARLRSIDTDYKRAERQRNVLTAIIEEYKTQSLTQMLSLLEDILPLVTTNISKGDLTQYATSLFPMFSGARVETLRLPADGTFTGGFVKVADINKKVWCQYDIDFEANRKLLEAAFAE